MIYLLQGHIWNATSGLFNSFSLRLRIEVIMGKEIERKFLVNDYSYRLLTTGILYRQGYISTDPEKVIRVRIVGNGGYLTLKGLSKGAVRSEFEYEIPLSDAQELISLMCIGPIIEKTRYTMEYEGMTWEIDEFTGDNEGLCIAEIELESEDQAFLLPPWAGREVTHDPRYYNANLVNAPYKTWADEAYAEERKTL